MAVDPELATGCARIVEALCVVPGDRAVIVTDRSRAGLAAHLAEAALAMKVRVSVHVLEDHGTRPFLGLPPAIRADLTGAQASVLWIGIAEHPEIPIRREIVGLVPELRLRHAHLLDLSRRALAEAFGATAPRIAEATRRVRGRIRPASTVVFRSRAGSQLEVHLDPAYRWGEHAGIIREGHWENLPSGLLMTHAPRVSGTFVADGSLMGRFAGHTGSLAGSPIAFVIEDGRCRDVRCADGALGSAVRAHLASEGDLDRVGLVVLGTNVGIQRPLGELLVDQCAPGLHLTFGFTGGDSTGAPWCSRGILTVTSAGGDVDLDGAPLVRGGRLLGL